MTGERDMPGFAHGGREPRFDISAEIGNQGELYVDSIRDSLRDGSAEVKTDERAAVTGNCFFEYSCRLQEGWAASGIAATEAAVWVHIVAGRIALVIPVDLLRPVCRVARGEGRTIAGGTDGGNPTRGVLLPFHLLLSRLFAEVLKRSAA